MILIPFFVFYLLISLTIHNISSQFVSNVKDQRFYFLSNGNWYSPENIVYGYDVEREFEAGEWMIYQIPPPPEWTLFKKISDSFEVGIKEQPKTEIQFDENKIPAP